jgi:hypothetical protein
MFAKILKQLNFLVGLAAGLMLVVTLLALLLPRRGPGELDVYGYLGAAIFFSVAAPALATYFAFSKNWRLKWLLACWPLAAAATVVWLT